FGMLIIKTHISSGNRGVEFQTGFAHAFHSLNKLVIYFGLIRVSEIETVRYPERGSARANNIARSFSHSHHGALIRICQHVAAIAVGGHGDGPGTALNEHNGCV